jgi:drug/metabolite transporter (DMT)-like permease
VIGEGIGKTGSQRQRHFAELALIGNTIVWGATFTLVKSALGGVSAILFLALRFSLASLALTLIFRKPLVDLFRKPPTQRDALKNAAPGLLVGLFLFLGYLLQTQGLRYTSAPKSAFLTGLTSVLAPLFASFVYGIKPRISEVFGLLTALAGLALMTLPGASGSINRGDLLTLFGAAAFAAHIVTLGHFSREMRFELLSVMQVGTAAVLAITLFPWAETPRVEWQPTVLWAILITGLLATALAFTVQAWAQKFTTSTRTALIYMLEPVVAWMTSYLLAGEGLSRPGAAGAALILGGVLLVELKPVNPRQHPS